MDLEVSRIQKEELSFLMREEAFKEGWFYSQMDVDFYYSCPQNSIYTVKVNNHLAGCVILHQSSSLLDKKPVFSAGLFLVLNEYRGQKVVGPYLWQHAITKHLKEKAVVCFHAVPRAVEYYQRLNYKKTSLIDLYFTLQKEHLNENNIKSIASLFDSGLLKIIDKHFITDVDKYNTQLFSGESGQGICGFMLQWLKRPDAIILGYYDEKGLQGYGVVTVCRQLSKKISYRLSPLYADTNEMAQYILKGLLFIISKNSFSHIELNTLATTGTQFGDLLIELGFVEKGKNFIVCNRPELIDKKTPILQHIFCSIPLEYPHEVIAGII